MLKPLHLSEIGNKKGGTEPRLETLGAMTVWYPLRLEPIYRQYIWGGNRFASVLDRDLDSTQTYAESWEVVDHGKDQSVWSKMDSCAGSRSTNC